MSLMDALLLEGYRDPRDVYIALRSDGLKGSGTIDDPYDGGTRNDVSKVITTLTHSGTEATATVASHGYVVGEVVVISGVTGAGATQWNGTFIVLTVPDASSFKFTLAAVPAASAALSGTSVATRRVHRFDEVMRSLGDGSAVRIGEGVFETRGCDALTPAVSWSIRPGQRIFGSGIGATTLRLVHTVPWPGAQLVQAIGHNPFYVSPFVKNADDVEIADLTVDCNMRSQAGDRVAKAAVYVAGSHVRIRRVRAIDYGTHIPGIECFVLGTAWADPRTSLGFTERRDSRIQQCALEQPSLNGLYTNTCMILGGGEDDSSGIMGYHRGCAIRENYVNNESVDNPVAITSIQFQGGAWVVTTRAPHGRANGDWVILSGAVDSSGTADTEGRSVYFNGTFQITGVTGGDPFSFQITPAGSPATSLSPVGDMWVGRYFTHRLSVKRLDLVSSSPPVAKMTTYIPHNKKPGDWVNVYPVQATPAPQLPYYGRFQVVSTGPTTPTELYYRMDSVPGATFVDDGTGVPLDNWNLVFMGVNSIGFSSDGGSEAVAEGNAVFNTNTGGSYHDTYSSKDQTDRNNYYSNVIAGPQQSITGHNETGATFNIQQAASVTVSGTTVTFNTTNPHGLVKGQGVYIQPVLGPGLKRYFAVSSVPTANSFSIEVPGVGALTPPYTFAGMWQVGLAVRERNVVEVGQVSPLSRDWGPPSAFVFYTNQLHNEEYMFRRVVCRENAINLTLGTQNTLADAFVLRNVENALVEANLVNLPKTSPWEVLFSEPLHVQGNATPAGALLEPASGKTAEDISKRIEEALLMSL